MKKKNYLIGALALILIICLSSVVIVVSDDYSNETTDLTLGSSVSKSSITPTQYSSASISISSATVTIRVTSSGYSSTIDDIYKINWGDGTSREELNSANNASKSHTYSSNGNYTISITIETWKDGANLLATTSDSVSVTVNSYSTVTNYTVRYNLNGGYIVSGISSTRTVSSGTTITLPGMADVEKDNAYLSGWTLNSTSGTKYPTLGTYRVTSNVTFYAEWTTSTYAVFFYANGGTGDIDSKSAEYGSTITLPTSGFTREGYSLTGWNTKADGSGTNYALGESFLVSAESKLYAVWTELPLSITSTPTSDPYPAGTQYIYDPTASKANVTWSLENAPDWLSITGNRIEGTIPYSYLESATVTFTLKATSGSEVKTQLVTINIVPKEVAPPVIDTSAPSTGKVGELYSFNPTEKVWFDLADDYMGAGSGYDKYIEGADWLSFKGDLGAIDLIISGTPTEAGTYTVTVGFWKTSDHYQKSNIRIQWTINVEDAPLKYTVTYDDNGGTGETSVSVAPNETITLKTDGFSRSGYVLTGWNTSADGSGTPYNLGASYKVTGNITLYAQWVQANPDAVDPNAPSTGTLREQYRYQPISNGKPNSNYWVLYTETWSTMNYTIVYNGPEWLSMNRESRALTFEGTPTEPGLYMITVQLDGPSVNIENSSLVTWTIRVDPDAVEMYTVTFDSNGGRGSVAELSGEANTAISIPSGNNLKKEGYVFVGWNTRADGSGSVTYMPDAVYTLKGNATLYAKWEAGHIAISFNSNGGSGDYIKAAEVGASVSLPSSGFSREGYTLMGWYVGSASGTIYLPNDLYVVSENTMFYAAWASNSSIKHTVSFSPGNGNGTLVTVSVADGTSIHLMNSGRFSYDGHNQKGWNTSADGTGTSYGLGDIYTVRSGITFYADWEETGKSDSYTVTFIASGSGYSSQNVQSGSKAVRPMPDPISPGMIFSAWTLNGQPYDFNTPVTSNLTLVASFNDHFNVLISSKLVTVNIASMWSGYINEIMWSAGGEFERLSGTSVSHVYDPGTYTVTLKSTDRDDESLVYQSSISISVSESTTPGADNFTIKYNGNGIVEDSSVLVASGTEITLEEIKADGYKFISWNTSADGSGTSYKAGDKITVTSDITLYAQWEEDAGSVGSYDRIILAIVLIVIVLCICLIFGRQ